jgi:bifunctional non-homologous end joining protein LigD
MAAHAVTELPGDAEWSHELKLDGYRAILVRDGARVEMRSRNDRDLSPMFPQFAAESLKLHAEQVVIDGELVALDPNGRPSFQALQHRGSYPNHHLIFYAFDVLHVDGRDVMSRPIEERRAHLPELISETGSIKILEELPGTLAEILQVIKGMRLEGVVAKRRGSLYVPGAGSRDWLKLKLEQQQEFVIGGYRPEGTDSIDALVVGYYDSSQLKFAAKVRAGFVARTRRQLAAALKPLIARGCPFHDVPSGRSRWGGGLTAEDMQTMRWVRPELVAQIRFSEWTLEGRLRHAYYLGLRQDKNPADVRREFPIGR